MGGAQLNRIPDDRDIIKIPYVPYFTIDNKRDWFKVGKKSPMMHKRAALLAARMFHREGRYDTPLISGVGEFEDNWGHVVAYGYTGGAHHQWFGASDYLKVPAWAFTSISSRDLKVSQLAVVWVHPHYRNRGLMSEAFPKLATLLGDSFMVDGPIEPAMIKVLEKSGDLVGEWPGNYYWPHKYTKFKEE